MYAGTVLFSSGRMPADDMKLIVLNENIKLTVSYQMESLL
jgi:hypothetical protein